MRMCFFRILAIFILTVHVCKSANVATIMNTCYASNQKLCHSNQATEQQTTKYICHNNVAYSWCEIFDLLCAHKLEATHIRVTTNPACNTTLQVLGSQQPIALTTTHSPPYFETHFFAAAQHGIDDLLYSANRSGATVDEMKKIYTKQDHAQKSYVRNTKCWAYPLDLTSISPWNSESGDRKAGVLISPRHALWVRHYSISINTTLRFVDRHNNVVDRKITRAQGVPVNGSQFLSGYDMVVGELDSDVPSSISFSKVMPRNLTTIRPPFHKVPAMDTDFEEKALVADLSYESGNMVSLTVPETSSIRHLFYEDKIVGDSGNPVFLVVNNELLLMFMFTYGGAGSGTSVTAHFSDINNILANWGSTYSLTEMDLTSFAETGHVNIPSIIG